MSHAAALGSVILMFLAAFIPLQRKLIARRQFTTVTGQFKAKIIDLGMWRYPAAAFVALIVFCARFRAGTERRGRQLHGSFWIFQSSQNLDSGVLANGAYGSALAPGAQEHPDHCRQCSAHRSHHFLDS